MLTELKLTNFRIFHDEVAVRFRPITILIGRNSAGKSSIVKFLLMLQQSSGPGRSQFLTAEGDSVSLGAFPELKNSLTRKRNLSFELSVKSTTGRPNPILASYLDLDVTDRYSALLYKAGATVSYGKSSRKARAHYSLFDQSSDKQLMKYDANALEDSTFWDYPSMPAIIEMQTEFQRENETPNLTREEFGHRFRLLEKAAAEVDLITNVRHQINAIRHLSAVRDESKRVILASYPPDDYVGQTGQHTLPHLQEIKNENGERFEFILPHLNNIAGIENVNFKTSSGYVSRAVAKNRTTGADALIADFGFGVGQCLPILVQGAIMDPYTTLMVEQPEAQLHPTAQLELGEYFADLWKERNVASIIETHSDNILLRLRRLIAKGDLSHEDVSVAYFTFDEQNAKMPIVENLDINEDGSMESGLPMEFFGADVIEGLKLGARA